MSILARFSPPSMTSEQYDAIVKRLYKEGVHPAEGLELEIAFGSGDQMKVSILFDSMEAFQVFSERMSPIVHEMGLDPGSAPYPSHLTHLSEDEKLISCFLPL